VKTANFHVRKTASSPADKLGSRVSPLIPFWTAMRDKPWCFPTFRYYHQQSYRFTCFDSQSSDLYPDDVCRALYSPDLHKAAVDSNTTMSYGTVIGGAVGLQKTTEVGTVYGRTEITVLLNGMLGWNYQCGGRYSVCVGLFTSMDDFRGQDDVFVETVGEIITYSTSQVTDFPTVALSVRRVVSASGPVYYRSRRVSLRAPRSLTSSASWTPLEDLSRSAVTAPPPPLQRRHGLC